MHIISMELQNEHGVPRNEEGNTLLTDPSNNQGNFNS